jgi:maltooligosyltrehalose trehalohydrolase
MTAYWLLSPGTPMFFQGQEYGATTPFLYFADHEGDLAAAVQRGRAEFMRQFPSAASRDLAADLPDASSPETRRRCVLDDGERQSESPTWRLHRDLLRLRRSERALAGPEHFVDGTVLRTTAFALRFFAQDPRVHGASLDDRLLVVNLGARAMLRTLPHPLVAPPNEKGWSILWSSDEPAYGGAGTPALETRRGWRLPAHAAVLLAPNPTS